MFTNLNFVRTALPGGKAPSERTCGYDLLDLPITIPFAVMAHDDGMDYGVDDEGNEYAYQDDYPNDFVYAAFLTKEEAEAHISANSTNRKYPLWIEENHVEPLWAFGHLYWEGKNHWSDELLSVEEANQLSARIVKTQVTDDYGHKYYKVSLA